MSSKQEMTEEQMVSWGFYADPDAGPLRTSAEAEALRWERIEAAEAVERAANLGKK